MNPFIYVDKRSMTSSRNAFRPESIVSRARKNSSLLCRIKNDQVHLRRRRNFPAAAKKRKLSLAFTMPLFPVLGFLFLGTFFIIDNLDAVKTMMRRDVIPSPQADSGGQISMAAFADKSGTAVRYEPADENLPAVPDTAVITNEISAETIPLKMVEYFAWESYTVKSGESVSSIAANHGLSMDAIIAANNLTNAHLLKIGQEIRLPNMDGIPYTVKNGDTLSGISKTYNIPLDVLVDVNNIQQDLIMQGQNIFLPGARLPAGELKLAIGTFFVSPLKGTGARLSSMFGWREDPFGGGQRLHEALDMAIPTGTTVKAASAGKVSMVGVSPVYGNYIIVNHNDNYQTLYAHLSVCSVKQGSTVEQGDKLGEVGSTGLSTGPHLHFAIYKNGRAVNPLDYISM